MILEKLHTKYEEPIQYAFADGTSLNERIGTEILLEFTGNIFCRKCAKPTKKSFGEGFCYPCFLSAPEASPCIINPELCEAHLGKGRDLAYEEKNHNQPHYVYLAATDQVKVGVTRTTQMPTRWIDQGAREAIVLAETPNRYLAGVLEVALKEMYTDITNWKNMLRDIRDTSVDLVQEKWELMDQLPEDLGQYFTEDEQIFAFEYPVLTYPATVAALKLDSEPRVQGKLTGIRGQYLYIDDCLVLNVRRHTGYEVVWK
jgi:hypothetical protein